MTIPGSANPLLLASAAEAGAYAIERSVRFNSADSAYLSRTPASAGNRKTWTWAGWVKRSALGVEQIPFTSASDSSNRFHFFLNTGDTIQIYAANSGSLVANLITTQVFRDPSSWYHFVLSVDTTQATASNRIKIYVNGSQVTAFSTSTYPAQNTDLKVNDATPHYLGTRGYTLSNFFSGYLADVFLVDGAALDPTSFGEFDTNGIWQPIAYTGTYGTNGFHLPFSDNSTAAALGTDTSGNGNTWTVNNISVTAGAGNDSLVDVPTNGTETDTGLGGEVRGNYCTMNPLDKDANTTLSNGNLNAVGHNSAVLATFGLFSGKWYWEVTHTDPFGGLYWGIVGVVPNRDQVGHSSSGFAGVYVTNASTLGGTWSAGSRVTASTAWASNDVVGMAFDADALTLDCYKNGVKIGSTLSVPTGAAFPSSFLNGTSGDTSSAFYNFGQRPFAYTAPSGFKALCTANLPAPVVTKPSEYMDVALYTGNGSTQTISGLEFSPDFVWIKERSGTDFHILQDRVRGAGFNLNTNNTNQETGNSGDLITSFNSDGFTVNNTYLGSPNTSTNGLNQTQVAWTWDAGSSTVTNTDGSITSTVRANTSAGFSIVTYSAGASGSTVGHGLGVAPGLIIAKSRTSASSNWPVYHAFLGGSEALELNKTSAAQSLTNYWGTPSSTTFGVYNNGTANNVGDIVAYCFAPVDGYSSFGSYTGNGSTDGPFVYTGFRPRWVLIKRTNTAGTDWIITDSQRNVYNVSDLLLKPHSSAAEVTFAVWDMVSNGFKIRTSDSGVNQSGSTYVWASFAESPFQYTRAR